MNQKNILQIKIQITGHILVYIVIESQEFIIIKYRLNENGICEGKNRPKQVSNFDFTTKQQ